MHLTLYQSFLDYQAKGLKGKSKEVVMAFIASFENEAEKRTWTFENLPSLIDDTDGCIRHELYREIIFPVLLQGYQKDDPWCLVWLVKTLSNANLDKEMVAALGFQSEITLLEKGYARHPENEEIKDLLLLHWISYFQHCLHEWPAGILFGADGASIDECGELLESLNKVSALDTDGKHQAFLADFRDKLNTYITKLRS